MWNIILPTSIQTTVCSVQLPSHCFKVFCEPVCHAKPHTSGLLLIFTVYNAHLYNMLYIKSKLLRLYLKRCWNIKACNTLIFLVLKCGFPVQLLKIVLSFPKGIKKDNRPSINSNNRKTGWFKCTKCEAFLPLPRMTCTFSLSRAKLMLCSGARSRCRKKL